MVRLVRLYCPPDTGFEIQTLEVCGVTYRMPVMITLWLSERRLGYLYTLVALKRILINASDLIPINSLATIMNLYYSKLRHTVFGTLAIYSNHFMTLSASFWQAGAEMHTGPGHEFVITAASSGTWEFVDNFQEADDVACTLLDIIGNLPSYWPLLSQ